MHNQITKKRIYKELNDLEREPRPGITCYPKEDNISELEAYIKGHPESPYKEGLFKLSINIPDRYPFEPPSIKFVTRIYHPNIDEGGRICADILKTGEKGGWNPAINLATALLSIRQMMATPNPDDPLEVDIAQEFKLDYPTFESKAKEYTKKYASEQDVLNDNHSDEDQNVVTDENKEKSPVKEEEEESLDLEEEEPEVKPKSSLSLSKKKVSTSQSTIPSQTSSENSMKPSLKARKIGLSRSIKKVSTSPSPPPKSTEKVITKDISQSPQKTTEKIINKIEPPSQKTSEKIISKIEPSSKEKQLKVTESSSPPEPAEKNNILIEQNVPKQIKKIDPPPAEITIRQDVSKPTTKKRSSLVPGLTTTTVKLEKVLIFEIDKEKKKKEKSKPIKNNTIQHDKLEKDIQRTAIKMNKNSQIDSSQPSSSEPIHLLNKESDSTHNNNIASSAIDIINHAMLLSKDTIIELSDDDEDEEQQQQQRPIYHSLSLKRSYPNKKISLSRKRR